MNAPYGGAQSEKGNRPFRASFAHVRTHLPIAFTSAMPAFDVPTWHLNAASVVCAETRLGVRKARATVAANATAHWSTSRI